MLGAVYAICALTATSLVVSAEHFCHVAEPRSSRVIHPCAVLKTSIGMASGSARYLIGVDGGTESLRAAVVDLKGALVGTFASEYETQFPKPGWAEQRPEDWWSAMGRAVKGALQAANVTADQVAAMSVDTTCCTVVALGQGGAPLRPALLWMDMRSAKEAGDVAATRDPAIRVNSGGAGPVSAEWMVPKSLWIKRHEPDTWAAAATICEYQDFINLRLTGVMCASVNNAAVRWHYSTATGWPTSLLSKLDLSDLVHKWPQKVIGLGEVVGPLTPEAATHLGLNPGLIVAQGGADAFIGMIGLGVTAPGQMALLTGSSHLQLGLAADPVSGRGIFGSYAGALVPGLHVVEGGQTSTGSIVNWFKRTLCAPGISYEVLNQEAAAVAPGCEGLTALDHFQGNRTPHTDAGSRGALAGLTLAHGRGHVMRALMESVACGTRLILDTMSAAGYTPTSIAIAGGATRSPLWLQIHADIAGVPFILTRQPEAPLLGCAILAAVAAGFYPDIPSAAKEMVVVERVVKPQPGVWQSYAPAYSRYCQLYPALQPLREITATEAAGTFSPTAKAPKRPAAQTGANGSANGDGDGDVLHSAEGDEGAGGRQAAKVARTEELEGMGAGAEAERLSGGMLRGIVAPSILAADFMRLGEEVGLVLAQGPPGRTWIHVDVFDGSTLARGNLTIGPPVVASLRAAHPNAFLDVHLAVDDPGRYVDAVLQAGASSITFHIEAPGLVAAGSTSGDLAARQAGAHALAARIRAGGARAGLALSPDTGVEDVRVLLQEGVVDMVLAMTVMPGWGGQAFLPHVMPKVAALRAACPSLDIQVDGGINATTAATAVAAGANILVAGSAVFGAAPKVIKEQSGSTERAASNTEATAVAYQEAMRKVAAPFKAHGLL